MYIHKMILILSYTYSYIVGLESHSRVRPERLYVQRRLEPGSYISQSEVDVQHEVSYDSVFLISYMETGWSGMCSSSVYVIVLVLCRSGIFPHSRNRTEPMPYCFHCHPLLTRCIRSSPVAARAVAVPVLMETGWSP